MWDYLQHTYIYLQICSHWQLNQMIFMSWQLVTSIQWPMVSLKLITHIVNKLNSLKCFNHQETLPPGFKGIYSQYYSLNKFSIYINCETLKSFIYFSNFEQIRLIKNISQISRLHIITGRFRQIHQYSGKYWGMEYYIIFQVKTYLFIVVKPDGKFFVCHGIWRNCHFMVFRRTLLIV